MVKLILIRHGEPVYTHCDERSYIGHGRDLAPLSPQGVFQAEEASRSPLLSGAEFILTSPYTRALQTAAIISKNTGLNLKVEIDLHEWMPDLTFQYKTSEESFELLKSFCDNKGIYPIGKHYKWETLDKFMRRITLCISKYLKHERIIVVTHGGVIRQLTGVESVPYCGILEVNLDKDFKCFGWVE